MLRALLLIEDEPLTFQDSVGHHLTRERGFDCQREVWSSTTPKNLRRPGVELVVFAGTARPELLLTFCDWLRQHPMATPIVAILPEEFGDELLQSATEAVDDFVFSPLRGEELRWRVNRILGKQADNEYLARQRLKEQMGLAQLVGEDPGLMSAIQEIPAIAASPAPVLLVGETGTGKELCAQAIHSLSPCHAGPFIPVDCGAIPENLVENELFGHLRGAFTDAHRDQKGLVAMADGGTLFLDEIDSLAAGAQAKLLRFIQEGVYRPLGSQKFGRAVVRLISATNRDLDKCVRDGQFRADLYFRLNVLPLRLPPLRERTGDIAILANYFLKTLRAPGQAEKKLSLVSMRTLEAYDWPGNVRELYNIVQRAVALCAGSQILPAHLRLPRAVAEDNSGEGGFREARSRIIEEFEKVYLESMLKKNGGNVTRAARAAGKDRRVFGRLMKRYRIERHTFQ